MEGLLFCRVYPSDGFRFTFIPDGNPSHEFPVLDGNPLRCYSVGSQKLSSIVIIIYLHD
jgi:hypothetical protein